MELLTRLWRSSLGKKYLMALSGCALFLFVVGHMLGNLQIFIGPGSEAINRYGHFLQTTPEILWPARVILLTLAVLHGITAIRVWLENRAARPLAYANYTPPEASYASRTMFWGGVVLALFIIYHLLHFTAQTAAVNLTDQNFLDFRDDHGRHDIYKMMVLGFRQPVVSAFYMLAMAALCLHLSHGAQSWLKSLGLQSEPWRRPLKTFALLAALIIFIGNCSIPVAILLGFGKEVVK